MSEEQAVDLKRVRVNYKSGHSVEMLCESFEIKHNSGTLVSISYTTAARGTDKPIYFGNLESVESVYQVEQS